jgi:hypothetical protein
MHQLHPSIARKKNFYKFTRISKPEPNNGTHVAELYPARNRTLMTRIRPVQRIYTDKSEGATER